MACFLCKLSIEASIVPNKFASSASYFARPLRTHRIRPNLAGNMSWEHRKNSPPLLPAQPLLELHDENDDPNLSSIKPPTPATTPFHRLDSHVLPSWPDPSHSIWGDSHIDATSLQREYMVEHGIIQVYHCSPGFHRHTPMPLRDPGIPNLYCSQEADYSLESASVLCLPPLRFCQLR